MFPQEFDNPDQKYFWWVLLNEKGNQKTSQLTRAFTRFVE